MFAAGHGNNFYHETSLIRLTEEKQIYIDPSLFTFYCRIRKILLNGSCY